MRASERTLPPLTSQLASIWLIFVLLGLGLQVLIQYSVLRNGELDWAAWASSIANDFLLMLPFLLVLGLPVLWLGAWSRLAQTPGLHRLLGCSRFYWPGRFCWPTEPSGLFSIPPNSF